MKAFVGVCAALALCLAPVLALLGCRTYVLSPADVDAAKDDAALAARLYRDLSALDAGRDRAYARGIYCDERATLRRSGELLDGGPIACEPR